MALAWAQSQGGSGGASAMAALMSADAGASGPSPSSAAAGDSGGAKDVELPLGYVVILTHVLPDGLGDLIFGENAVLELQRLGPVAWIRCYTNDENSAAGERLVEETAASLPFSLSCSSRGGLEGVIGEGKLAKLWVGARERFLAPWIFGLSAHEEALLQLASRHQTHFWALTEYGRGMGNIHTYTQGLGAMIPTGWVAKGEPGGVFRSIQRTPHTETDWRRELAQRCGAGVDPSRMRLWWFYSRKDDEKKHDFRTLDKAQGVDDVPAHVRTVAKVVPVDSTGRMLLDANEKTSGEKLAEQLFKASKDPNFKPDLNVACAEVAAGCAAQLSQFLWGVLFEPTYTARKGAASEAKEGAADGPIVDVVVTPNIFTQWREASGGTCAVAQVTQMDLTQPGVGILEERKVPRERRLFICSMKVPRREMRTFLEQCEERVYTTGDQSLAEAMFMGKLPCVRPDAKVQQWEFALMARFRGAVDAVPDLGAKLRRLVEDPGAREEARRESEQRSKEVERHITAQLGGGPSTWTPTHQVLARAGMLG